MASADKRALVVVSAPIQGTAFTVRRVPETDK